MRADARAGVVRDLALLVKDFPGDSRVNLLLEMSEGTKQFVLGPQYKVKPVAGLLRRGEGAARRGRRALGGRSRAQDALGEERRAFLVLHLEDAVERQVADRFDELRERSDVERRGVCAWPLARLLRREMDLLAAVAGRPGLARRENRGTRTSSSGSDGLSP